MVICSLSTWILKLDIYIHSRISLEFIHISKVTKQFKNNHIIILIKNIILLFSIQSLSLNIKIIELQSYF